MVTTGLICCIVFLLAWLLKISRTASDQASATTQTIQKTNQNIPELNCLNKIPTQSEIIYFITDYFTQMKINYHNTDGGKNFWIAFKHSEVEERNLFVFIPEHNKHIEIGCYLWSNIPDESLPHVAELVNRINEERIIGKLVLLYESRQVIYSSHIILFDVLLNLNVFNLFFQESYHVIDRYNHALKSVIENKEEPLMAYLNIISADENTP